MVTMCDFRAPKLRPIEKLFGDSIPELDFRLQNSSCFSPTVSIWKFQFWFTVMHGNTKGQQISKAKYQALPYSKKPMIFLHFLARPLKSV